MIDPHRRETDRRWVELEIELPATSCGTHELTLETRTLGMIAITPLLIATLLVFVLLPDGFAVMKRTTGAKAATTEPAKH